MKIRKKAGGIAAVGAVAMAVAVGTSPASAHGAPFTVTAGSASGGTSVPVTLRTVGPPGFVWKDTTTGVNVACAAVTWRGAVTTGATGARVGTIDGARSEFTGCTGPAGLKFVITGFGTWTVDVSDSAGGRSVVSIGNVRAHLVTTAGPTCAWDFAAPVGSFVSSSTATTSPGTAPAAYDNGTAQLSEPPTSPGSLGLWNVHGGGGNTYCVAASVWKQGDRMSWSATWKLTADTAAYNPVAIS